MEESKKTPLAGMTLADLKQVALECGLRSFAAGQIARWLYEKRVDSIDAMTDLPKAGRERLAKSYTVGRRKPVATQRSTDGTVKYLFPGPGKIDIESVYIPDRDRATLCVSSQAGCRMNCSFCMTGRQGFHGNLTSADIINQVLAIDKPESLTNIVFMGMGEPLDNHVELFRAIEVLTAPWGMAWSPKRITVSTVGKLDRLSDLVEKTKVHVAVSLHNPFSEQRLEMMPVERAFPIAKVIELLRHHDWSRQRRLSIEYTMWEGVNDSPRHAAALARMLAPLPGVRVNIIRFHRIPGSDLRPCTTERMEEFRDRLNSRGITATIRASRGEDIMAACGMLAGAEKKND